MQNATEVPAVLVADDAPDTRFRLADLIADETGVGVVADAADAATVFARCAATAPRCVVIDPSLRGAEGVRVLAELTRIVRAESVVVLVTDDSASFRARCAELGVRGPYRKAAEIMEAMSAIRGVVGNR